ncbi:histidine phosphatase family protein [Arcobacter sp. FWKO B]|uniref:histidine phosphatase family protein n=1 Tax=Arcobacter sp. FWKO B TaxID=2593672 RepID=UPI0018A40C5A|nr:histidine phosphatase family protein [Arcobacter sp. FWKO B]QOG12461.1 histidine phosphatase family protein [Arcobacter sp. FWKO B]
MALTLLRHSAPSLIYHKRYLGWSDIEIDTDLFSFAKVKDISQQNFDFIYSSDLKRCTQTLDKLNLNYTKDKRLKELRFKEKIELKSFDEIEKLPCFKQEYLNSEISWFDYISDEDYYEFENRIKSFLDELDTTKNILLCSHKGTLNMILEIYGEAKIEFDYLQSYTLHLHNISSTSAKGKGFA